MNDNENSLLRDYGKILESFYFEILGPNGEMLREAQKQLMAFPYNPNDKPGNFAVWQFEDVELDENHWGNQDGPTWRCYMKNVQHQKYVHLTWRDREEEYNTQLIGNKRADRVAHITAMPMKNGVREWRILVANHALTRQANSTVLGSLLNNRSFRWTMRLRYLNLDYHMASPIKYLKTEPDTTSPIGFTVGGDIVTGDGITVTTEQGIEITRESTFELAFTQTLAIGATVGAKVKAPGGFGEASAELRVDVSLEASQRNVITESITYHSIDSITVDSNTNANFSITLDWVDNEEWPFEAKFDIRGTALKADGDTEADALHAEEVKLVLVEKGFDGTFLESVSKITAKAQVDGVLTGSFGFNKHINALNE